MLTIGTSVSARHPDVTALLADFPAEYSASLTARLQHLDGELSLTCQHLSSFDWENRLLVNRLFDSLNYIHANGFANYFLPGYNYSAVPKRGRCKRGRTQKHANERKRAQKSANKRVQKSAKGRKRAHPRTNCKQLGLKQPRLGTPNV